MKVGGHFEGKLNKKLVEINMLRFICQNISLTFKLL